MATSVMANAVHPAPSPLAPSSAAALTTPELLLLTEALVQLAQQTQQTQQVSLADVDWAAIATMLAARYPLGSSTALTPNLLSSQLLAHLSSLSAASSPSSIPLAALITLSTSLKQQRLQQLKDDYAASTVRQQQLEEQLRSAPATSSSLPARPDLPVPPTFPSLSASAASLYPSTPLLMSPLQRSVSEKSRLPSTPLPPTAASNAHMPPLEESTMAEEPEAAVSQQPQPQQPQVDEPVAPSAINVQVTPPPPLLRTITDMELDRSPEPDTATEEADPTTTTQQPLTDTAEPATADAQQPDTTDTSPSTTTSSSPTNRLSAASIAATCLEILTCLQRHPDADPFRYPVDPTEVPNYYDTIRQPMDFDTIQSHLQQSPPLITSPQQFHERLLLVFQNAYTFNDKKTSFYKMAKNLDAFAADLCRKYWPEEKKSFFASPEARKLTGRQSKVGQAGAGGVKEVELDTPVGPMVVAVVSAPSSPTDRDSGAGAAGGAGGGVGEDDVGGVVDEGESAGRKGGRGGRGGASSVASTPTGAGGERMGTRKGVKGTKAEDDAASSTEADDGKAGGRKKAAQAEPVAGRGRGGARRKSEKGEPEEEEKVQEDVKAQETPKSRRGRGRGRGH